MAPSCSLASQAAAQDIAPV